MSLWTDYVEAAAVPAVVPDAEELVAMEDQAQALRFREVKAKMAQDIAKMMQFNAKTKENTKRLHVVSVMHEKSQLQTGKELLVFLGNGLVFCNVFNEVDLSLNFVCNKGYTGTL